MLDSGIFISLLTHKRTEALNGKYLRGKKKTTIDLKEFEITLELFAG